MPRAVPVLNAFLYPRHVGGAPLPGFAANLVLHGTVALRTVHLLHGMTPFLLLASFLAVHAWMWQEYRRDHFCQYRWLAALMPIDFRRGPGKTGPKRIVLRQRTRNLGGAAGRRYTP